MFRLSRPFWAAVTLRVPAMGDSVTRATIGEWRKSVGEFAYEDEAVLSVESEKTSIDVNAPLNGTLTKILVQTGEEVDVGTPIGEMEECEPPEEAEEDEAADTTPAAKSPSATPKAAAPASKSTPAPSTPAASGIPSERLERRVRMTPMRKTIAERLLAAGENTAMLTTFQEVDMKNITEMRQKFKDEFQQQHGTKLGFMSAFVKASSAVLMQMPAVNASIDGDDIVYHDYCDISVAVATPTGLVVPVLRDVQAMDFADVEKAVAGFGEKARSGQITKDDMMGGTFTISNGGVFGSLFGTPILNPPQSAILGMHNIVKRAVVDENDNIVVRPIMVVALTYDHRLLDGREAATFLVRVKKIVENPERLLLGLA